MTPSRTAPPDPHAHTFNLPRKGPVTIRENFIDRAIGYVSPAAGRKRLLARVQLAIADSYFGASQTRRQTISWQPEEMDADSHVTFALANLRKRSRDLVRNSPLAFGAINTVISNVIGTGLKLDARINRDILKLTDDQADAWERTAEQEWQLFFHSRDTDAARILTGPRVAALAFRSTLENGDVFVNLPRINRASNPYSLSLQLIEADRVCNEGWKGDETTSNGSMIAGVKKNTRGEPLSYAVCNRHPVSLIDRTGFAWREIPAYGAESGLPNILHLYEQLRPDQTRGLPYLTPVIEAFKMLDRYTEAELMAAVVSAMLTVFIKSEADFSGFGTAPLAPMQPTAETGGSTSDTAFKLASGAILALRPGEDIATMNPGRPNTSFDPFVLAILRQIGVGLGLPFEVLIKHFTSSYSAARAALLDAWKFFIERREWLASQLYQPIYEIFLYEAIALGRINAPGYFDDPLIRLAYSGAQWTGPARGMIDETKEVQAATDRVDAGMATMQEEVAALTGTDWEAKLPRIRKERAILAGLGLPLKPTAGPGAPPQDSNSNPNPHDEEGGNALSQ